MTSIESQLAIDALEPEIRQVAENFHQQCLLHLARAQVAGKKGWNDPSTPVNVLVENLNKAVAESDWTSVFNYAMMLNHRGVVSPANDTDWQSKLPAGAVFGF